MQFATNHLGHFALANGLHGALAAAGSARIVAVISVGHDWRAWCRYAAPARVSPAVTRQSPMPSREIASSSGLSSSRFIASVTLIAIRGILVSLGSEIELRRRSGSGRAGEFLVSR
jgi:hypothetical protein